MHPFGYSVLTPWLMATIGVAASGMLAAVLASVVFARIVRDTARPWAAALTGAVFWVADVASGRVTFALGAVAALLAVACLPREEPASRGRLVQVGGWALLTALMSPVAAAFLGLVAAVLVLHRRPGGWTLGLAASLPVGAIFVAFPGGGIQPFTLGSALPSVLVTLALAVLTESSLVRTGALLYSASMLVLLGHDDPFGSNVQRLGWIVALSVLLATTSRRSPAVLVVVGLGFLAWQSHPLVRDVLAGPSPSTTALTAELVRRGSQRAEVVGLRDHRESWAVAEVVPLARGWSRQLDFEQNPLFYQAPLWPQEYLQWLRTHSVDYVASPRRADIDYGSTLEYELLKRPVPGLREVWRDDDWVLFAVQRPRPLIAPPAQVLQSTPVRLVLRSDRPTVARLDVGWSRWLSLKGPGCLERVGRRVRVRFLTAGTVEVSSSFRPQRHC